MHVGAVNTAACVKSTISTLSTLNTLPPSSMAEVMTARTLPGPVSSATCTKAQLSGIGPGTSEITRLFHPRRDLREEHFIQEGIRVVGRHSDWPNNGIPLTDELAETPRLAQAAARNG